jgi:hypothetical protein
VGNSGDRFRSSWERAVAVVVRTAHLGAMAVLVGGLHFAAPDPALRAWRFLTAATGVALLLLEASHSRHWLYQGRGVTTLLHVGALALVLVPGGGPAATIVALSLGAVGSHLPRTLRKWSFRHGRVVD